ncbi:MAG: S-adenosylmethionine:tRNA ribosyltransferase-isomerase [Rhodomicrobium sp.]|nr:MAG: S-adenosylmethionine:tRNA ribosyltransferase-isomerase [Rhodomicrobium sp.]
MQLDDFDFTLPEELIALYPPDERDGGRLLHVSEGGDFSDNMVKDLPSYFEAGDVLVVNDSRVLPAALDGVRIRGEYSASIHLNLHKRVSENEWLAFAKPAKRLKAGDLLQFGDDNNSCDMGRLDGRVETVEGGGEVLISFSLTGAVLDERLKMVGAMPLPPYIAAKRAPDQSDFQSYQTVYSQYDGSVAAPTAGLHFTPSLLNEIEARGVKVLRVTLHVGAGTFLPVKTQNIADHQMHAEWGEVTDDTVQVIKQAKAAGKRVCAVGTTSLRLLEAAAKANSGTLKSWRGETDIFITPGFQFQVVDRLMTNFHLPKSTLFMLVSAFSGSSVMKQAYAHAIDQKYRFYSYGDASLLERGEG